MQVSTFSNSGHVEVFFSDGKIKCFGKDEKNQFPTIVSILTQYPKTLLKYRYHL